MVWFIGVDVGGTFTDFYAFDAESGAEHVHKTPSTPDDPSAAILGGLEAIETDHGIEPAAIQRIAHGTTVATNSLIQRKGVEVALITTKGFRDLLEIGRQIRPRMYDLKADDPPPLAPRRHRFEIEERIGPRGEVVTELTDAAIDAAVEAVRASGAEACAVGLLFAFLTPDHEQRIGAALAAAMPELYVSLSSAVQPEFREYERLSTTVLNAYLQPIVTRYMERLREGLARRAPNAALGINQSSGGLMSIERAGRHPIRTALSGPAAGAVGAVHVAGLAGRGEVITLDMGGTSADVCLVRGGKTEIGFDSKVADFPVRLPKVDIHTIGAGGGSIAWFDRDGLLKVGPVSAGAEPGPACYGHGGTEPTVTDANLVLGRLSPKGLLGGAMALDGAAAEAALAPIADRLGYGVERSAHGVIGIVVANMVRAIRVVSIERGHDPRDYALMAFGGAGPLHAADVAIELGISEIIVPPAPGILCAQGLVVSDLKEDFVATARTPLDDAGIVSAVPHVQALLDAAEAWFAQEAVTDDQRALRLAFDMRYIGQNFELTVPVGDETTLNDPENTIRADDLRQAFFEAHERSYGFHNPDDTVEIVNYRLTAFGRLDRPSAPASGKAKGAPEPIETRAVWFTSQAPAETPVYDRSILAPGHEIAGPAVVEQLDSTTLVRPGDTARVDGTLSLIIEVNHGQG